MLELLRLQDDSLTSEVMQYLVYGKPMPFKLPNPASAKDLLRGLIIFSRPSCLCFWPLH